jgi:hypothetical protein
MFDDGILRRTTECERKKEGARDNCIRGTIRMARMAVY